MISNDDYLRITAYYITKHLHHKRVLRIWFFYFKIVHQDSEHTNSKMRIIIKIGDSWALSGVDIGDSRFKFSRKLIYKQFVGPTRFIMPQYCYGNGGDDSNHHRYPQAAKRTHLCIMHTQKFRRDNLHLWLLNRYNLLDCESRIKTNDKGNLFCVSRMYYSNRILLTYILLYIEALRSWQGDKEKKNKIKKVYMYINSICICFTF